MTRLADVEEMAQAPPDGARASLRPGDVAGLYAVLPPSLDGWGEGLEPFEAMIVDVPGPGAYLGELPDGSLLEFGERNIAWVGPSMGGIFDWVKRAFGGPPPPPSALPALPPPPAPVRPAARPSPVKETFLKLFAPTRLPAAPVPPPGPPAVRAEGRPSFFDWFRPKRPPPPPSPPIVRPETFIAPTVEVPSMFAPFAPAAPGVLERIEERVKAIIPPTVPGLPIEAPEIFRHIKPTPVESFEAAQAKQMQLWQTLFPEPEPGKDVPLSEMFKPFAPEEASPEQWRAQEAALPPIPKEDLKILPLPARNTLIPAAMDVARGFMTRYEPIEQLWDLIRRRREDPVFQRAVDRGMRGEGPGARFPFESLGMCDGAPDAFQAVAAFLNIPWNEVERRGQPVTETDEEGNEYTRLTNFDKIYEEIVFPASEVVTQAFELIKPPDLAGGNFVLEWGGHKGHSCQLLVAYAEGTPVAPGEVRDPALEEPAAPPPPPPVGYTTLGDLVPAAAAGPMTEILNAMLAGQITRVQARDYMADALEAHRAEMEAKGVLPEYITQYLSSTVGRSPVEYQAIEELIRKEAKMEPPKKRGRKK